MNLYEILIPVANNDGKEFPEKYRQAFIDFIGILVGGVTVYPVVDGQWYEGENRYAEKMIPVRINCTDKEIDAIAWEAKKTFEQKKIFVATIGTAELY